MLKANYHTHTHRCRHACGDVADYCRAAVALQLEALGFTDHTPMPDGRWRSVRMDMDELPGYVRAMEEAKAAFPDLLVLKGMECEFVPEFVPFYRDVLLAEYRLDYLIAGAHWYPHDGFWSGIYGTPMDPGMLRSYTSYLVACMESELYAFIAHPDLFGVCYLEWDEHARAAATEICRTAAAVNVPLEINAYGYRKPYVETSGGERPIYPWAQFWEVAATCDAPVIVNSDAHRPEDVLANTDQGCALAQALGLRRVRLEAVEEAARAV